MRDVEALDPDRRRVEAERELQPFERLDAARAAALGAQALLVERQPRVALGQLQDPALLPALGRAQLDRPAAPLRERLGERRLPAEAAPSPWKSSRWTISNGGIEMCEA